MSPEGYFDFKSTSEEEEKLDYNKFKSCPNCKKSIAHDATICYFCGREIIYKSKASLVGWIVVALAIILSAFALNGFGGCH